MGEPAKQPWISYADYLALERAEDRKYEWLDGRVYAMAGGTLEHSRLAAETIGELRRIGATKGCHVYTSDAKVRVLATGLAAYPDVAVVCGPVERDPDDPNAMTNPAVLVEVLSDGTEAYDRGEKFRHYRRVPSLRDYVLVSQHERCIEVYSRDARGRWVLSTAGPGEAAPLTAMEGALEVDRVYGDIELPPAPPPPASG